MHFHFLLQSSQKFSRPPRRWRWTKNAFPFSSSVITKIFSSSFVVGDEQKCISIFFFSHHKFFLVFLRRWRWTKNAFPFSSSVIAIFFSSSFVAGDGQK